MAMKVEARRQRWVAVAVAILIAAAMGWWGQPAPPAPQGPPATPPEPRLTSQATMSANVVQLMVAGNGAMALGTADGLRRARDAFTAAAGLDERYAPAHAALADALAQLAAYGAEHPEKVLPPAISHADRSIELDPSLPLAWRALAQAEAQWSRDWPRAEMHYERAMTLAADSGAPASMRAQLLLATGRSDEALTAVQAVLKSNPGSADVQASIGLVYRFAGRPTEALACFDRALALNPKHGHAGVWRAVALADLGRLDEAVAATQGATEASDPRFWVAGYLQALSGRRAVAEEAFKALAIEAKRQYVPAIRFAYLSLALGQREQALQWIETSVRERSPGADLIAVDPTFRSLRDEPRFRAAVTAMKLDAAR